MTSHLVASRDGTNALMLTDDALAELRATLRGRLLTPTDPGFAEASLLWNGMIDSTPALVVRPIGTDDVVAAVNFARTQDIALSVRGGGHNIAGTAVADGGLTIDLSGLRGVAVDPVARTATVAPGCQLGDVDRATQEHGLATPLGFASVVGVSGLTLGGGLGYLTRRFGWTVDNLLEVEIVTADGVVRRASRAVEPELFWAVRGAGANLGVVTEFTFRLHEVGPAVSGGLIAWPFERAGEVLRAYRTITERAPRELAVWLILTHAPPVLPEPWPGKKICVMLVCYSGDPAGAADALAPIRALGDPIVDQIGEIPYTTMQSFMDDGHPSGMHYYWRTEYHASLSDKALELAHELFAGCPISAAEVGYLHIGGALNDRAEDDGAVGNRDARYAQGVLAGWPPDEPRAAEFRQWIRDAGLRSRAFGTGRTYINFQAHDEPHDRTRASYGANYDRLVAVKLKYDPDNLFRSNRNVMR